MEYEPAGGLANDADATLLAGNWQTSINAVSATVPEPSAAALLLCIAMSAIAFRYRR